MRMFAPALVTLVCLPLHAAAQTTAPSIQSERAFVAIHLGGQAGSTDASDQFSFAQYDETATVGVTQAHGGGGLLNVEGGVRVIGPLFAGVAFSRASTAIDTRVEASIPNPLEFDRPRTAQLTPSDLDHSATGVHLFARYTQPLNARVQIGVSAGPTFYNASPAVVSGIAFQEGVAPFSSVTLTSVSVRKESETITTLNVGANVTVGVTSRIGVDGFFRYARGTWDVPGQGGPVEVKVGGTQVGVGARFGF